MNLIGRIIKRLRQRTEPRTTTTSGQPPGPAGIPLLGSLLQARRDPLRFVRDLTREYGDIAYFRIGIYTGYLLNHPDFFQHVLVSNHRNYNKENYNYKMLKPVLGEGLITADGDHWLHQRRLIQPVFHRKRIARFDSTILNATEEMLDRWEVMATRRKPIPVAAEMMNLTLRVVTESLFSTDIRSSAEAVRKAFNTLNRDISDRFKNVFVPPRWLPIPRNRSFKKALGQLNRLVYQIIEQRRREPAPRDDLLDMLLEAGGEGNDRQMTDRQLRDEVMTLMLAGHETTANLLTWTCYLLSRHPTVLHQLKAELDEVLGERNPGTEDLPAMVYTQSVLKETLRLYPPVWIISRKAIDRDVIGGYAIPAESTVTLCSYALHRHPGFWEDPETFRPERFSADRKKEAINTAYFPFGGGPRSCLGSHFAMMEAQIVLAMIFRRFNLKLTPGHPVEPEPLVTLRPRHGLSMRPERW